MDQITDGATKALDGSMSLRSAFEKLVPLLCEPGCPSDRVDGLLKVLDHIDKCVVVKLGISAADIAVDPDSMLQPSDLFSDFVAAFRAHDWPQVAVIEYQICS